MRFTWDPEKERKNIRKHGLQFSFADAIFSDPLAVTIDVRVEGGEHRYQTIGAVNAGKTVLVVVHSQPDPDDDTLTRVIGLRQATRRERRRYEESNG